MHMEKTFAEILSELMKKHSFTQKVLADKLGVKQSQVSNWLLSKSMPGYNSLRALSRTFNVKPELLLGLA